MNTIEIKVAKDFSETPGARYIQEGPFSGELFYKDYLKPQFEKALKNSQKLTVFLDGTAGYATSFLDESFGQLARDFTTEVVLNTLNLVTTDSFLEDEIKEEYINLNYKGKKER